MVTTRLYVLALAGNLVLPAAAIAQQTWPQEQGVPSRNANIWDGRAHEPTPGNVQAKERAAGVAPDRSQQQNLDQQVEQLDKQIMRDAQTR